MQGSSHDNAALYARTLAQWRAVPGQDLLLFAYGSLIWRPDFDYTASYPARVQGYHRALRMQSQVNRGSPEQPGLVLALLSGGSCRGLVFRVAHAEGEAVLEALWAREMPLGEEFRHPDGRRSHLPVPTYEPRWLSCQTTQGPLRALAFTLSRHSPSWTGEIGDAQLLHIFGHARGRYGTTLEYLMRTVHGLREHGIRDVELERQWHLAARHGLCGPLAPQRAARGQAQER
ncbi:gamma-glutamylcyclotransferase [Pelomonas sp. KK5]|uniref:gamma-glutamylcyclotransferase n=1 Tax=Pelomonas sp. KK5 TaxID=1855730 RepID=UPI00117DFFA7|nr:gamma-glutamylcyclotransferase [Pelomonas sp. KK5]